MVMIQGESLGQRAGTLPPLDDPLVLDETQDDEILLARLQAGDEIAFRALVARHRPWLVRLCTRLLGYDAHAAEDAAQESLLKLHRAARDGRPLRVRPWLTVVARNTCVDEQRRRRPDLPGELPERAAPRDDDSVLDLALTEAWSRLSGRHREVLYLREVLGFSYKEIGAVMDLTMPATETLVFRARAALRREYERSGATSFGCGLLGFHLARLGLGRRKEATVADGMSNAAAGDGISGLTSRLAHFLSTTLPGCGEQAVAKVLAVAAGVVMAAGAMLPGLVPFADTPAAAAAGGLTPVAQSGSGSASAAVTAAALAGGSSAPNQPASLKALLGSAVPADWAPQRSRTEAKPASIAAPTTAPPDTRAPRITPLRDATGVERPTLNRPVRGDDGTGPLRSILPERPRPVEKPERPHPLRSLLADPVPIPTDPLPAEPLPADPQPVEPFPVDPLPAEPAPADPGEPSPAPAPGERPKVKDTVEPAKDTVSDVRPSGRDQEERPRPLPLG